MRILLTGGGTAGHINPALAIAGYSMSRDSKTEILFVGTKKGLEKTLVPSEGYGIKFVNVDGLKKELSFKSAVSAGKMAFGLAKSVAILKSFKPDVVVGTGGYVCVPAVMAAKLMGIPSLIHEQNVFPGSAVKFLSDKCSVTAISFDESKKYINNANRIVLTGNPVRPSVLSHSYAEARKSLGIEGKKVILSFGGSLGARYINDVMIDFAERNSGNGDIILYFGTGKREYDRVMEEISKRDIKVGDNIRILPYIDNMDVLMNAADVVICRSGAITLAELCALGKPSVLIPSPNVTNNHQEYNARALSDVGAAITITEDSFNVMSLEKAVFKILYDDVYATQMAEKAKSMGITDACKKIYEEMLNIIDS